MLTKEFKDKIFTSYSIKNIRGLYERASIEAMQIYGNPERRRDRTPEQVLKNVLQGLTLEFLLVENIDNYEFAPNKYHDIIDKNTGDLIEVKAYNTKDPNSYLIKTEVNRLKASNWNHSKYMIVYSCQDELYTYLTTINLK